LKLVGLFAGVGGFEQGLAAAGLSLEAVSENDPHACKVLEHRLGGVPNLGDVTQLKSLPRCDVVACGFPCQDLSPAGGMAGIGGAKSGLVSNVWRLLKGSAHQPDWLVFENVPFILSLHGGAGIALLTQQLERLKYRWAYRVVDSRAFGLAQRRRRLFVLASRCADPARLLFANRGDPREPARLTNTNCGFYWTEGNKGVGWAVDAIPPLKGTSGVSIVSPPGIWRPKQRDFVTPTIADAEALQGFKRNWTSPAELLPGGVRVRWRLVGNAVSVPVAKWLGRQFITHAEHELPEAVRLVNDAPWPTACFGERGMRFKVDGSEWPGRQTYVGLSGFLSKDAPALSLRAATGFMLRLNRSRLHVPEQFRHDLSKYCEAANAKGNGRGDEPTHGTNAGSRQRYRKGAALGAAS
jgi:DNA (cytosine-5)-methyltransferase 1